MVLTNAGTRFRCNKGTNLSCKGNPLDDSPHINTNHPTKDYVVDFTVS